MYVLFKYWVGQKVLWAFFRNILQVLESFFLNLDFFVQTFVQSLYKHWTFLVAQMVKKICLQCGRLGFGIETRV